MQAHKPCTSLELLTFHGSWQGRVVTKQETTLAAAVWMVLDSPCCNQLAQLSVKRSHRPILMEGSTNRLSCWFIYWFLDLFIHLFGMLHHYLTKKIKNYQNTGLKAIFYCLYNICFLITEQICAFKLTEHFISNQVFWKFCILVGFIFWQISVLIRKIVLFSCLYLVSLPICHPKICVLLWQSRLRSWWQTYFTLFFPPLWLSATAVKR